MLASQGVGATTLQEAVQLTINSNPDIAIVVNDRIAIDEELNQARGLYLPQVDAAAGIGKEHTNDRNTRLLNAPGGALAPGGNTLGGGDFDGRSGKGGLTLTREELRITVQQRVFDGLETANTIRREKARIESAARRIFENSEFIGLDAVGAFVEVLRQQDLVAIAQSNLDTHLGIQASLEEQLAAGAGRVADVTQTQARVSLARNSLTQAMNEQRDAAANYARIVGQFPDSLEDFVFPEDALPPDLETAVLMVSNNNPTEHIFEADVRAAEAEVGLAEVPMYPIISIEGDIERNRGRDGIDAFEFNQQGLLRLRWNLFRGGIDLANRREALARVSESKSRRYQAFLDAQREVRLSWYELESNRQQVEDLNAAVQFNVETRDAYIQQFDVGQRTLLDVLDVENELFVSRGLLVTANRNTELAGFRILALNGVLLSTLGVSPPGEAVVDHPSWWESVTTTFHRADEQSLQDAVYAEDEVGEPVDDTLATESDVEHDQAEIEPATIEDGSGEATGETEAAPAEQPDEAILPATDETENQAEIETPEAVEDDQAGLELGVDDGDSQELSQLPPQETVAEDDSSRGWWALDEDADVERTESFNSR